MVSGKAVDDVHVLPERLHVLAGAQLRPHGRTALPEAPQVVPAQEEVVRGHLARHRDPPLLGRLDEEDLGRAAVVSGEPTGSRAPAPNPQFSPLTSSLRATWQMWTGRWYSWATISTAATVCRSAWATMGRCRGHCSRCWGEWGRWAPLPGADLPRASPCPPAHLHPQRHVVHPQAGEGVVQVHLEPGGRPSQGAQSASVVQGSPQEEGKITASPSLSQLQDNRQWVLWWWDHSCHQQRAQHGWHRRGCEHRAGSSSSPSVPRRKRRRR